MPLCLNSLLVEKLEFIWKLSICYNYKIVGEGILVKIKFDRDSVCLGDDIDSHNVSFDVDEEMTIDDFIKFLYSKANIARIGGGEATWILQLRNGRFYIDIAVFAEQWNTVKYFSTTFFTTGEIIKIYNSNEFFAKYLGQKDPEMVYDNLKELRFGY